MNLVIKWITILCTCLIWVCGAVNAETVRTRVSQLGGEFGTMEDLEAEVLFGRDLAARILGNYIPVQDQGLIRYVNLVGKGLGLYSGRPELEFRFIVLESDEVNAFATPGGYIFITHGAIALMDNEAQLACVLSHEIAHVTKRHVVRKLDIHGDGASGMSALTSAIGSTTAAFRTLLEKTLDEAADILFEKGYELHDEMEADLVGTQIAALAGYDPWQMNEFLIRCKGFEKPDASYKGEHPQLKVRLKAIQKFLEDNGIDKKSKALARRRFYEYCKK